VSGFDHRHAGGAQPKIQGRLPVLLLTGVSLARAV